MATANEIDRPVALRHGATDYTHQATVIVAGTFQCLQQRLSERRVRSCQSADLIERKISLEHLGFILPWFFLKETRVNPIFTNFYHDEPPLKRTAGAKVAIAMYRIQDGCQSLKHDSARPKLKAGSEKRSWVLLMLCYSQKMDDSKDKLRNAMQYAMDNQPKIGGFPFFAECLRKAGVEKNLWSLPGAQSIYIMKDCVIVNQGTPLVSGMVDVPTFDEQALVTALRVDQEGQSTFPEFLTASWNAGVIGYEVDFLARTVLYYGARGEKYIESYPPVTITEK